MMASWLEVTLIVDGELAEAVAEVLARFAPGGVAIESVEIFAEPESEAHPVGPLRVCGYLPVNPELDETRHRLEEALWFLGRIRSLPEAQFNLVQETDWAEAWKEHYHPIAIGQRLIIVPAWLESPDPDRVVVRMDPGMAFGTGTHPTTQLCLELIEAHLRNTKLVSGILASVIDIGCGSGILAISALKLGAKYALGVDIDPLAVSVSNQNATANGVADSLELGEGSVSEILAMKFTRQKAELVIANILAPVIIRLLKDGLGDLLTSGGSLILSGILDSQAQDVESAASSYGLQQVERRQMGDWVAMEFNQIS